MGSIQKFEKSVNGKFKALREMLTANSRPARRSAAEEMRERAAKWMEAQRPRYGIAALEIARELRALPTEE